LCEKGSAMTLRTKTFLLFGLMIAAAFLVSGFFYLRFLQQSLKHSILSGVEAVAESTAENIARFLEDSLRDAQAAALSLPLKQLEKSDLVVVEEQLARLVEIYPKFENGMFILDRNGRIWVDYPPHPEVRGQEVSYREYFQRTMREERGIIGVPYVSLRTGQPVITFTALLRSNRGEVLGLLGCSVQILSATALDGVRRIRIGKTGYVYVFDRTRKLILHPDDGRVLQADVPPGANRLFDAALNGFEGVGETVNSRGVPMLLALKRIRGTDWIVGAQQPQSEAYAPLARARWNLLVGGLLAVLTTLAVGAVAVRRITEPLARLRRAVMHLGSDGIEGGGEIAETIKGHKSTDEIGELTEAFAEMSRRLQETMTSLRRASLDWERTFNAVPDLIALLDEQGRVVKVNLALAEKLSVAPETVVGIAGGELFGGVKGHSATAEPDTLKELLATKLGPDYLVSTSTLKNPEAEPLGSVYVARNISERRRAEEERERMLEQLAQAQKMEALGTLAGGIAHDFNNILSAMIGYTELGQIYQREGRMAEVQGCLEEVLRAGRRAKDLVNQILTFSRQGERQARPVSVAEVLEEGLKFLRAFIPSNIEIRASLPVDVGMVMADPVQLQQVVINLGTNAYQAMERQGGILEVALEAVEIADPQVWGVEGLAAGSYIRVTVKDSGEGMSPQTMGRIFEPFFTTKGVGGGTGLGLSVVHGIVKDLGGAIKVDSQLGMGTTFEVYLPRYLKQPVAAIREPEPEIMGGEGHIMVVDDEPQLLAISQKMLTRLGYQVTAVSDPQAALEIFQAQPEAFDLLLTDLTMPQMTGLELAREVLQLRPDLPIILTTGFDEETAVRRAWELGIRDYLLKPVVLRELAKTVRRVMDDNR